MKEIAQITGGEGGVGVAGRAPRGETTERAAGTIRAVAS